MCQSGNTIIRHVIARWRMLRLVVSILTPSPPLPLNLPARALMISGQFSGHQPEVRHENYELRRSTTGRQGRYVLLWKEAMTDLVQIRRLGEQKRDENLHFRKYLKTHTWVERQFRHAAERSRIRSTAANAPNAAASAKSRWPSAMSNIWRSFSESVESASSSSTR